MDSQQLQDELTRAVCLLPGELQNPVIQTGRWITDSNGLCHPSDTTFVANTRKLADALAGPCRELIARVQRESQPRGDENSRW